MNRRTGIIEEMEMDPGAPGEMNQKAEAGSSLFSGWFSPETFETCYVQGIMPGMSGGGKMKR